MRVTLLNQFFAPDISPTAQLAASLAAHRAELGDEVTVVAGRAGYLEGVPPQHGSGGGTTRGAGTVRLLRVFTPDLGRATVARRAGGYATYLLGALARMLRAPRQDLVVAMTTPPYTVLVALAHRLRNRRCRVVLWSMDCYPDALERFGGLRQGGLAARALHRLNGWAYRRVDAVVALDGAMAALLSTDLPAGSATPIEVVPNWEAADLFPADATPAPWEGYDRIGVDGRTVVLYLGNAGVGHRFDTVLDAAAALADEAVFVFVGGGARYSALARRVEESGLANVVLEPYVAKDVTASVMAGADLALITLDDRALGVMSPSKLHANLAAGLPVLYTGPQGSNVDEAIVAYGCGTSVRHGDVDAVVAAVRRASDDANAARRSRRAARRAFEERYCDRVALAAMDRILAPG